MANENDVTIYDGETTGPWAQIVGGDDRWTVSVFGGAGTILKFSAGGENITLQADDAGVVARWAEIRAAVAFYRAGPTAIDVQHAITRCRAALAEVTP